MTRPIQKQRLSSYERLLIVFSYILFFPSFSIIFTDRRRDEQMAFHAGQAMFLWLGFFAAMIALKALAAAGSLHMNMSFLGRMSGVLFFVFWLYTLKCSFVFLMKKNVRIPLISNLSDRLA